MWLYVLVLDMCFLISVSAPTCYRDGFRPVSLGDPVGKHKAFIWKANSSAFARRALSSSKLFQSKACGPYGYGHLDVRELPSFTQGPGATIAIHPNKDSAIAISVGGRVQCVLELERLFGIRYFAPRKESLRSDILKALYAVRDYCVCDGGKCPTRFENGVIIEFSSGFGIGGGELPELVGGVFSVRQWRSVNHHEAHALLGFHASGFRSALVISYDGGGDDGNFNAFLGRGLELRHVVREYSNLGEAYPYLAVLMPEVTGISGEDVCSVFAPGKEHNDDNWVPLHIGRPQLDRESDAGKLMGYSATGVIDPEISHWVRLLLERKAAQSIFEVPPRIIHRACSSVEGQRCVASSVQAEFQRIVISKVRRILERVLIERSVEGIVITGGCALNVLVNQAIRDTMTKATSNSSAIPYIRASMEHDLPLDVYVPPAPNDGGLAIGGLWAVDPPIVPQQLQYLGFPLWDEDILDSEATKRGAKRLSTLGGVEHLAELLVGGEAWLKDPHRTAARPIVAVVRGRQELGPRALGHRSLLAVPDSNNVRERLNRVKFRKWYRPVAPMVADEALEQVFGHQQKSPFMEMAPRVRDEVRRAFPGLAHFDGTARHQSVGKGDEPWLHSLLLAVGKRIGLAALINTSFNTKGKPIVNRVEECLEMLDTLPDLDYVLINDWLFRAGAKTHVVPTPAPMRRLLRHDASDSASEIH